MGGLNDFILESSKMCMLSLLLILEFYIIQTLFRLSNVKLTN